MVKVPLPLNASTKRYHKTQALMGATRPAGIKAKAHTPNKDSQTVLNTLLPVNLCLDAHGTRLLKNAQRDESPPDFITFLRHYIVRMENQRVT